jgi:hypothetical protein
MINDSMSNREHAATEGRSPKNIIVLCAGILLVFVGILFSRIGVIPGGGAMLLGVFFVTKGASRLQCSTSDCVLGAITLSLALFSKISFLGPVPRLTLDIAAILTTVVFLFTGLSLKSIIMEQRRRKP